MANLSQKQKDKRDELVVDLESKIKEKQPGCKKTFLDRS